MGGQVPAFREILDSRVKDKPEISFAAGEEVLCSVANTACGESLGVEAELAAEGDRGEDGFRTIMVCSTVDADFWCRTQDGVSE
jgi:hypothetical protein